MPKEIREILLCVLLMAMQGCTVETEPPLRVGSNPWIGYEPVYLARSLGFLDEHNIHLVELRSATQVMNAIRAGNLEVAMLTLDEVLTVMDKGIPLRVIAVLDISNGADVLLTHPGGTLESLRGQRIGVENTALGAVMLQGALDKAGLTVNDIDIVPVEFDDHEEFFLEDRVDAVVTFEPIRTRLINQGAEQIFDSSEIPNQIIDVMVVRQDIEQRHWGQLKTLVESYFKALDYLNKNPEEATRRMAPRLHITAAEMLKAYEGIKSPSLEHNREWLKTDRLVRHAESLQAFMVRRHLLEQGSDVQRLNNASYLPGED